MPFAPIRIKLPRLRFPRLRFPRVLARRSPGVGAIASRAARALGKVGVGGALGVLGGPLAFVVAAGTFIDVGVSLVIGLRDFLEDFLDEQLQIPVLADSFEALVGGEAQAETLLAAMKKASSGLVREVDLIKLANRALQSGVADNEEELSNLLRAGHLLGRAVGIGVVESSGRLIDSLARADQETLIDLGISQVEIDREMVRLTRATGETVKGLAPGARIALFAQAALRVAKQKAERFATTMVDTSNVTAQAAASIRDILDKITLLIARSPEVAALMEILADGVNRLSMTINQSIPVQSGPAFEATAKATAVMNRSIRDASRTVVNLAIKRIDTGIKEFQTRLTDGLMELQRRALDVQRSWKGFVKSNRRTASSLLAFALGRFLPGGAARQVADQATQGITGAITSAVSQPTTVVSGLLSLSIFGANQILDTARWYLTGEPSLRPPGVRQRQIPRDLVNQLGHGAITPSIGPGAAAWAVRFQSQVDEVAKGWKTLGDGLQRGISAIQGAIAPLDGVGRKLKFIWLSITAALSFIQAAIAIAQSVAAFIAQNYFSGVAYAIAAVAFALAGTTALVLGGRDQGARAAYLDQRQRFEDIRPAERRETLISVNVDGPWHQDNRKLEARVLQAIGAAADAQR